ncbi:MAG: DUF4834 family protein [Lutibacter sp.]
MGLLKTLLIIIVVYYAFKFIGKFILPIFMNKMVKNVEKKFNEQQNKYEPQGEVGETVITKKPKYKKQSKNSVGDYVDFEEISDENND